MLVYLLVNQFCSQVFLVDPFLKSQLFDYARRPMIAGSDDGSSCLYRSLVRSESKSNDRSPDRPVSKDFSVPFAAAPDTSNFPRTIAFFIPALLFNMKLLLREKLVPPI